MGPHSLGCDVGRGHGSCERVGMGTEPKNFSPDACQAGYSTECELHGEQVSLDQAWLDNPKSPATRTVTRGVNEPAQRNFSVEPSIVTCGTMFDEALCPDTDGYCRKCDAWLYSVTTAGGDATALHGEQQAAPLYLGALQLLPVCLPRLGLLRATQSQSLVIRADTSPLVYPEGWVRSLLCYRFE